MPSELYYQRMREFEEPAAKLKTLRRNIACGELGSIAALLADYSTKDWFINDRDNIIDSLFNKFPYLHPNGLDDRPLLEVCSEPVIDYKEVAKVILPYARGVSLKKQTQDCMKYKHSGLTFLLAVKDVSGLDFSDISVDHEPISYSMLTALELSGVDQAIAAGQKPVSPLRAARQSWSAPAQEEVKAEVIDKISKRKHCTIL